jgi:DNA ligase-1
MPDLQDGETVEVKGSAAQPYELKNVGGVYSCSCPAWRNLGGPPERRTCKHLRRLRGEAAEDARIAAAGGPLASTRAKKKPAAATPVAGVEQPPSEPDDEGAPVLLAERWDGVEDPTGWWMSEKLDGVRAYWDGTTLLSRLGNPFHAPDWFLARLPATPLDGELWGGRRQFQRTVSIVRRQDKSELWREITFVVFDAPTLDAPFEERLDHCRSLLEPGGKPVVVVHEHRTCGGIEALRVELARVETLGGEGLMLRRPGSRYVAGRSTTLLKVKSFRDAEARVVAHLPGEGRHLGRLGALVVERPGGTRFAVGTGFSDALRAAPPAIGSVITYRYQELTNAGVPRFPSFVGVRNDVRLPPASTAPVVMAPQPPTARAIGADAIAAAPAGPGHTAAGVAASRRFELVDGTSSKFWEVEVRGAEMIVRFGRIGTAGQTKPKTFASGEAAGREAATLVAEKLGKGYREVAPGTPSQSR